MGALFSRVKTWVSAEDVTYSDLNAEFDNILNNLTAANVDDYSANVSQMQTTADPGEVGTESLATTLAGELTRLRFMIKEITGENQWYESPTSSLTSLASAVGTGITDNRIVSGRVMTNTAQPGFLIPNGAARTIKLDGTPTNFLYFVEGTEYTISTDVTLTNLTAAPSSNNTCLIDDAVAADQVFTKYTGEDGTEIPVDTMGSEISALVGKFAGFKLNNGSSDEYFIAYVESSTRLTKARRGYFFDSADTAIPRIVYSNNDTITLMKLTWVFAKADGTLTVTYTNPTWSDDEPSSPAVNDYWFDLSANKWKKYDVVSFVDADATLVGICLQDTTNTVAARSFDFFKNYSDLNTCELTYNSATEVKSREIGSQINVYGSTIKNEYNLHTWNITSDRDSGVSETSSTTYYAYLTETGDKIISDIKPHDRREDLLGFYHPHKSWRCVGSFFNNSSSDIESASVESYFSRHGRRVITPSNTAAVRVDFIPKIIRVSGSGGAFSEHLPAAALCTGQEITFIRTDDTPANAVTLDPFSSETINGNTTYALYTQYELLRIVSDGSNWLVLQHETDTTPTSYTPTFSASFGTVTTINFTWSRVGTYVEIFGYWTPGTTTGASATVSLPTGVSAVSTLTGVNRVGYFAKSAGDANQYFPIISASGTVVNFAQGANGGHSNINANTLGSSGNTMNMFIKLQVTGWQP